MAIAIVGLSPSSEDAPWGNPDWEIWGLPWSGRWAECDRLFEMHDLKLIRAIPCRPNSYEERLQNVDVPLYMQEAYTEFPCTRFPFEEVGRISNIWNSSADYMLSLAIYEGHPRIGIWGIDMKADEEYFHQRPNFEYLLGLARGRGIRVTLPDNCPINKFDPHDKFGNVNVVYNERYGKWH